MTGDAPAPYWPVWYGPDAPAALAVLPCNYTLTEAGQAALETEPEAG